MSTTLRPVESYAPGTFCWVELGTSDHAGAKRFYTELFGWTTFDMPIGDDSVYTMFQLDGKDVCASYELNKDQRAHGIPPHWLSYVSVDSADETAKKAGSLGGTVLLEPMDVFDAGRMTQLQDPTGVTIGIWQPRAHIGARLVNQPNTFCWNELATTSAATAKDFYVKLFGWGTEERDMGPVGSYTLFLNRERGNGGMYQMGKDMAGVPPHWLVCFAVDDCDGKVEKAQGLGAKLVVPPADIPEVGRFAVLQDPQGAAFAIIKLAAPLA